jgi:hypothetical protein
MIASGENPSDSEELKDLIKDIEDEIEGGAYLQFYIHCMVGQI